MCYVVQWVEDSNLYLGAYNNSVWSDNNSKLNNSKVRITNDAISNDTGDIITNVYAAT